MSDSRTAELTAINVLINKVDDLDEAAGANAASIGGVADILEVHTEKLDEILAEIRQEPQDEHGESKLEKLLRALVQQGDEHTRGLQRLGAKLDAMAAQQP